MSSGKVNEMREGIHRQRYVLKYMLKNLDNVGKSTNFFLGEILQNAGNFVRCGNE